MAKAVAKKKNRKKEISELVSPAAQRKAERSIDKRLMKMDEGADERMRYVDTIISANDASVEAIMDRMVAELQKMEGPPRLYTDGHIVNLTESEFQMLQRIQVKNFSWIAVRCLVACAEWGIRIGNFKLPTKACARCGKKVKR